MDRSMVFDILYALLACEGREKALFGQCAPAVREAFSRSLVGDALPELWFELPLSGEPWLDFHALVSYDDARAAARGGAPAFSGQAGVYADALAWFASQDVRTVRQLALSYDTSAGDVDNPAVQVLVAGDDAKIALGFLEAVGRAGAGASVRTFASRMPDEWFVCYVGAFPRRIAGERSQWTRLECIVGDACQSAYATSESALRGHLDGLGMAGLPGDAYAGICELARSPFPLELQFNVGPDGAPAPVVSASVRFQVDDWLDPVRRAQVARLATWAEAAGLSDARWQLLAACAFAKRVAHGAEALTLSCLPAFVKLRWQAGRPADAKAYLLARFETEGE